MFTVEVDLWQSLFSPPMGERSKGIVLTHSIQLPFVPSEDIAIHCAAIEPDPGPIGRVLKGITWDVERNLFLASTYAGNAGPIGLIPYDLRNLLDKGWRFGSAQDRYDEELRRKHKPKELPPLKLPNWSDEDELESWENLPPKRRPAEFNLLVKALVRMMAEHFEDVEVAYAIDKTMMMFSDYELETKSTPETKRFREMKYQFSKLTDQQRSAWHDRVMRRHPRIQQFVAGC